MFQLAPDRISMH